jgi:L-arabinokinase
VGATETENSVTAGFERFIQSCETCWPSDAGRPAVVARAPGRLDCMGGMADYSGSLALQIPIERAAYVAAGRREDQQVHVELAGIELPGEPSQHKWPISLFYQSDGQFVLPADLAKRFEDCPWARHVAGVMLVLLESGDMPHLAGGITLLIHSDIPVKVGLASSAAVQVATAKAVAALLGIELDPRRIAQACRTANVEVVGCEPGLVDHLTCLWGEADHLLQIRCQPDDVLGQLALPREVVFAGVDIGVRLPLYSQRYSDNRVSSLLGKYLIDLMLKRSGSASDPTGGYLANISPNEYVRRFRNELPVKIKGKDFVSRFGVARDVDGLLVADRVYKIRSRTEHHIYENDRTHRFMERLARAGRTGERDALVEAGGLMYASHWSYGQRCGMASIETDILVNCIRERGPARGLYGAKVTAGGCGGTVAVLMADTAQARQALSEAVGDFAEKTRLHPQILIGSSPGAMSFGHRVLD